MFCKCLRHTSWKSLGESIKHGTGAQRSAKSSLAHRPDSFHSFNPLFLSTCFVADIVLGTRDNPESKAMFLFSGSLYSSEGDRQS